MTTPELPPPNAYFWTPKPGSGLRPELKSWSTNPGPRPEWDIVGYYTTEEVAAAVLAEREKSEAMRAALTELVACGDLRIRAGKISPVEPGCEKEVLMDEWRRRTRVAWAAARAAIRAEPKKEQQP